MTSSNFGFGEQSKIASAYAQMYAPKRMTNESCCCGGKKNTKKTAKKPVKEACGDKLPTKHAIPKNTGSKLGVRKMLPFEKRDAKPSAKKFTPPVKKDVKESAKNFTNGFCIVDGEKTLCTNDMHESYFSKDGITNETRIYESAISALKDIKKVNAKRKPNKKYCIRKCQCVGESFEFVQSGSTIDESQKVDEGLLDGVKGAWGGLKNGVKAVKNLGAAAFGAASNALSNNGNATPMQDLKNAWGYTKQGAKDVIHGAANATIGTMRDLDRAVVSNLKSAKNLGAAAFGAASNALSNNGNATPMQDLKNAWGDTKNAWKNSWNALTTADDNVLNRQKIADSLGKVSSALSDNDAAYRKEVAALNKEFGVTESVADYISEAWWNPIDVVTDVAKGVGNTVGGTLKAVGNAATGDFSGAWDNVKQAGSGLAQVASPVTDAAKDVIDTGVGVAKGVGNLASAGVNAATGNLDAAKKDLSNAAEAGKQAIAPTVDAVKGVANVAGNTVAAAGNAMTGNVEAAKQNIQNAANAGNEQNTSAPQAQQQQTPPQAQPTTPPPTTAQQTAASNGAGPVTDAAAQKNPSVQAQQQTKNAANAAVNAVSPLMPNSVNGVMSGNLQNAAANHNQQGKNNPEYQKRLAAIKAKYGKR